MTPVNETDEDQPLIDVEVAYGTSARQLIIPIRVLLGTTAYEAVLLSGIQNEFVGIDPDKDPMGIFSKLLDGNTLPAPRDYVLQGRDRVEIYRPLLIDPKQARRKRAVKAKE